MLPFPAMSFGFLTLAQHGPPQGFLQGFLGMLSIPSSVIPGSRVMALFIGHPLAGHNLTLCYFLIKNRSSESGRHYPDFNTLSQWQTTHYGALERALLWATKCFGLSAAVPLISHRILGEPRASRYILLFFFFLLCEWVLSMMSRC